MTLVLAVGCGSPIYVRIASFGGDAGPPLDGAVTDQMNGSGGTGGLGSGGILGGSGGAGGKGGTLATGTGGAGMGGVVGGGGATGGAATGGGGSAGGPASSGGVTASGGVGTGGIVATGGGGSATGGNSSGGSGGGGAGGAAAVDSARYNFESSVQSWAAATGTPAFASIAISTAQHAAGQSSLAGAIAASAGATYQLHVQPAAPVAAGSTITFHVFYPTGAPMAWVQPYGIGGDPNFAWYGSARSVPGGTWNTLTVAIPSTGAAEGLGVQFKLTGPWTGTVYVDAVTW